MTTKKKNSLRFTHPYHLIIKQVETLEEKGDGESPPTYLFTLFFSPIII